MSIIKAQFIQDVADNLSMAALTPSVCRSLQPVIENQLRHIIQLSVKFQKRGKSSILTVKDLNLALSASGLEQVYGFPSAVQLNTNCSDKVSSIVIEDSKVSLAEFARNPLPKCPLLPDLSMHWLAIDGIQPAIPENPLIIQEELNKSPILLPKEMQYFFAKVTGILLSDDSTALMVAYTCLENDSGLQELLPYLSRFIYSQVKACTRQLPILINIMRATRALVGNKFIHLDTHLQQLMPALFTCVVGGRLSSEPNEDHWSLREMAAMIISSVCRKFSDAFPDLLPRVCRTYLEALSAEKSLQTIYGGLIGLFYLGQNVIKNVLLPNIAFLIQKLQISNIEYSSTSNTSSSSRSSGQRTSNSSTNGIPVSIKRSHSKGPTSSGTSIPPHSNIELVASLEFKNCRLLLARILGKYMSKALRTCAFDAEVELGLTSLLLTDNTISQLQKRRKFVRTSVTQLINSLELAEVLVPYYASSSRNSSHCRLFI